MKVCSDILFLESLFTLKKTDLKSSIISVFYNFRCTANIVSVAYIPTNPRIFLTDGGHFQKRNRSYSGLRGCDTPRREKTAFHKQGVFGHGGVFRQKSFATC